MTDIRIYAFAFGRPEFVASQQASFRRFLVEDHELVIVADGPPPARRSVRKAAQAAGVRCVMAPRDTGDDASIGLARAMGFAFNHVAARDEEITVFVHADVFLLAPLSLRRLLDGFDVAAMPEARTTTDGTIVYPWSGFVAFRRRALSEPPLLDFLPTSVHGVRCDTGGGFWHYWARRSDLRLRALSGRNGVSAVTPTMPDAASATLRDHGESSVIEGCLFHYLGGSDWDGRGEAFHQAKTGQVLSLVAQALEEPGLAPALEVPAAAWPPAFVAAPTPRSDVSSRPYRLICFSLYDDRPKHVVNAIINCLLAPHIYPGWRCRFYVDDSVPPPIERLLHAFDHVDVVRMPLHRDGGAMLWRFVPAAEPGIDAMISRDADSWLSSREAACVNAWLASDDRPFHIIRDHCYHSQKIMGGMWGVRGGLLPEIGEWIDAFTRRDSYDQGFLAEYVYPRVIDRALVHVGRQYNREGHAANYFNDGGVPMPGYVEIDEAAPGLSFLEAHRLNAFTCAHCNTIHRSYVGAILEHIPHGARIAVRNLARSAGIDPAGIPGLEDPPGLTERASRLWRRPTRDVVARLAGDVRRRLGKWA